MKYLPKFKWSDLSASVAHQRAMEAALLRNEISQSKKSQASYLDQVDKARLLEKRKQREGEDGVEKESKKPKVEREFKQRATIKNNQPQGVSKSGKKTKKVEGCSKDDSGALQNVMDNLFG